MATLVLLILQVCRMVQRGSLGNVVHAVVLCHKLRNPDLRKPQIFKGLLANLTNLCLGGLYCLFYIGQEINLSSAPEEDTISFMAVCYSNILEKIVWGKTVNASSQKPSRNVRDP